jgi:outer membrane protein OmpA-like peptidoglycan-associated protein
MIQTASTAGSGNSATVAMSTGGTVAFSGAGFVPGTVVDIYIYSVGTLLGTAVVRADGTYSVNLSVPVTLATGNHTAVVQGFVTAQSITSFQVGVTVNNVLGGGTVQWITFASSVPANPVVGDTYTVTAIAPGGPVSLSLAPASNGCTLSGTTVTFNAVGACTIYALAPGTAKYGAVQSSQTITVGPLVIAAPAQISATVGDRQAVVSWSAPKNVSRFAGVVAVVEASPGGATCSTSSANWCLVTGLLDGVSYTFTVTLITSGPTSVTTSIPSAVAAPTSVGTEISGGSQLNPGVGQIQRSDGTTSIPSVSTTAKSVTLTSGSTSVTIQTASTVGSGNATTVALVAGRTALFSGTGFIPGTIVDLYIYSPQLLLGTAMVQPDGSYAVTITFPVPFATGNYTAMVQGFVNAQQSLTSFAVGVVVPPTPPFTLTLSHFSSKTMKLTASMRTEIAKFVQALIVEGSVSINVSGFSDNHGTKAQNLARGRSRAASVSTYLIQQLRAIAYSDARVTPIKSLGQAKPTKSNATAVGRATNRRVVIAVTLI